MTEEEIIDEEVVRDEEETDEEIAEDEEKVEEDENEKIIDEDRYRESALDKLSTLKYELLRDKSARILLILNRLEGATLSRVAAEINASHSVTRNYLQDLLATGYIIQYKKYPDKNTYYRLSKKDKNLVELVLQIISFDITKQNVGQFVGKTVPESHGGRGV